MTNYRPTLRKALLSGSAIAGISIWSPASAHHFDLAAQPANSGISEFALQSGMQILAPASALKNRETSEVKGDLEPRAALHQLLKGTGLAVISENNGVIALGDDDPPAPAAQVAMTSSANERIEEVVVTAQKRSENLQKVPISITAIKASTALALGVTDTVGLQALTPSLVMHRNGYSLTPSLRGIAQSNATAGDESPIAVYVDGVYYASLTGGVFALNNIDHVEILKGPQGTLFGRNAAGGVISVITKTPQQKPSASIEVGYGNYNSPDLSFYGTTGITDKIATDLSLYYHRQYDGWGKNLTTGAATFLNRSLALRNKWLINLGDKTTVTLAADFDSEQDPTGAAHDSLPGFAPEFGGLKTGGFYDLRENFESNVFDKQWGGSAKVEHDFDYMRLVSISAYRGGQANTPTDQDGSGLNLIDIDVAAHQRQFTQELQLLSPSDSKIKWIGGFFYLNNKVDGFLTEYGGILAPPYTKTLGLTYSDTVSVIHADSYAGFGEVTVPIGFHTDFTGGLRYTADEQHIEGNKYTNLAPAPFANQRANFDRMTWRAALNHQFDSDSMGYLSYNRGYKSGVFNGLSPNDPVLLPSIIDAYETGVRSEFLDHRLRVNGAVFYYYYRDPQLQISVLGGTKQLNAGKAEIKGTDLDLEAKPLSHLTLDGAMAYTDARYKVFPNAPYAFPLAPTAITTGGFNIVGGDAEGNEMLYSPMWSANVSARYVMEASFGHITFAGNYYYNGGYFADAANQHGQGAYSLVNGSVQWTENNDKWHVRLWAKNLNGAHYYSHITTNSLAVAGSPAAPRTFGVVVGYDF